MSKIILFRGKAGTGKTTLSKELGKRINLPVIHKDDIYDPLAGYISEHEIRNKICFDILYKLLQASLGSKSSIIVDFGFNNLHDVKNFKNWIENQHGVFKSILCTCSNEVLWAKRLQNRKLNPQPNQLITDLEELKQHYKTLDTGNLEGELILDSVIDANELISRVLDYI